MGFEVFMHLQGSWTLNAVVGLDSDWLNHSSFLDSLIACKTILLKLDCWTMSDRATEVLLLPPSFWDGTVACGDMRMMALALPAVITEDLKVEMVWMS